LREERLFAQTADNDYNYSTKKKFSSNSNNLMQANYYNIGENVDVDKIVPLLTRESAIDQQNKSSTVTRTPLSSALSIDVAKYKETISTTIKQPPFGDTSESIQQGVTKSATNLLDKNNKKIPVTTTTTTTKMKNNRTSNNPHAYATFGYYENNNNNKSTNKTRSNSSEGDSISSSLQSTPNSDDNDDDDQRTGNNKTTNDELSDQYTCTNINELKTTIPKKLLSKY